jgi:hypothetical protein
MPFHIYEFCTGMERVQLKNGTWVSGASLSQIDESRSNYNPIPQPIRNAVENLLFEIDKSDSYHPLNGEVALIARDLGDYSVLAVATKEVDDQGARPLIAYRYFWLNNDDLREAMGQDGDFDGVGTLVNWWSNIQRPKFIMNPKDPNSFFKTLPSLGEVWVYEKTKFVATFRTQKKTYTLKKTNSCLDSSKDNQKLTELELQALALTVNRHPSWAWNVRYLEHPEEFDVIYCADTEAYNRISSRLPQTQQQLIIKGKTTDNEQNGDSKNDIPIIAINNVCNAKKFEDSNFLTGVAEIIRFSENLSKNLVDLSSVNQKNAPFPDETTICLFRNKKGGEIAIRYVALMVILFPGNRKVSAFSIIELRKKIKELKKKEKALLVNFIEMLLDSLEQRDNFRDCSEESIVHFQEKIETLKGEVGGNGKQGDIAPKTKLNLILVWESQLEKLPKPIQTFVSILIPLLIIGIGGAIGVFFLRRPVMNPVFWRSLTGQIPSPYNCTTQEKLSNLLSCIKLAESDTANYSNSQEVLQQAKDKLIKKMEIVATTQSKQTYGPRSETEEDEVQYIKNKFLPRPFEQNYIDQQIKLTANFIIQKLKNEKKYTEIETALKTCQPSKPPDYGNCLKRDTPSK